MNNREWLYSLDVADLAEWFEAKHVDATCDNSGGFVTHDSREKLDAEVRKWCGMYAYQADMVWVWLNRQAAITKAEQREWWSGVVAELQAKVDELTAQLRESNAERDEWKAKAEHWVMQYMSLCPSVDMDADANCGTAEAKTSRVPESDTREKLEADVHIRCDGGMRRKVLEWLDRQAAIVEREWTESNDRLIDTMRTTSEQYREKIAELTEQLEAAHAKNRALKAHISKMQHGRHGWHVKGVELEKENAELQAAYDELAEIAAQLCRACGFSMVDAAGEVVS